MGDALKRQEWLQRRRDGIGGSEAAAVLGLSSWKSTLALYCDKVGINDTAEDFEPDWLYWGKALEPAIAKRYEKETGREVIHDGDYAFQRSSVYPWMCCTIDRSLIDPQKGPENPGILSIKNVVGFKKSDWQDEPPVQYQIQLQHELIVLGRSWGSFAVLFNGHDFGWFDMPRNEKFCAFLIEKEREFWGRVLAQEPPPPGDPAESSREALQRLYPNDSGSTVALPGELIEIADRIEALKLQAKTAKQEIESAENQLKAAIGENTFGVLPNGTTFSLKLTKRAGYSVPPCEFRSLRKLK